MTQSTEGRLLNQDERSLLLYLEQCAVDHAGRMNILRVNDEDMTILKRWSSEGFIEFGRIVLANCATNGSNWVRLSDAAMEQAHAERKARALRMWRKRVYETTAEAAAAAAAAEKGDHK